jgi:Abortive infection alpha
LIGYLGGDWLRLRRAKNIAEMLNRTRKQLEDWGVKDPEPASLTLALPILRGAADESRGELQELWARLMAAALDPSRSGRVRQEFAEVISKMDQVDVLVLEFLNNKTVMNKSYDGGVQFGEYAIKLEVSKDEFETSVWNLGRLALFENINRNTSGLSAFARELLRVVSD